jgi:hypothetical protein
VTGTGANKEILRKLLSGALEKALTIQAPLARAYVRRHREHHTPG